jgi:hypothetical protein
VRTATSGGIARIRSHYNNETRDLFEVLLDSTSQTEANFALGILMRQVPNKSLVAAVNLREALAALPCSPFQMRVDEQTLMNAAGLSKSGACIGKVLPDGLEVHVTTAGNLVLDIIVRTRDAKHYLSPIPARDDFIAVPLIDLVVNSDFLLDALIDLVTCMGMVFNPKFYLSVEDWHLEYAREAMSGLEDLFGDSSERPALNLPEV